MRLAYLQQATTSTYEQFQEGIILNYFLVYYTRKECILKALSCQKCVELLQLKSR